MKIDTNWEESALRPHDHPASADDWRVYSDWLEEQGRPLWEVSLARLWAAFWDWRSRAGYLPDQRGERSWWWYTGRYDSNGDRKVPLPSWHTSAHLWGPIARELPALWDGDDWVVPRHFSCARDAFDALYAAWLVCVQRDGVEPEGL